MIESTKRIYIAFDGKTFDSKEECISYENSIEFLMLDNFGEPIITDLEEPDIEYNDTFDSVCYICCKTKEIAEKIYRKFHCLWSTPWKNINECCSGIWTWDDNIEDWTELGIPEIIIDFIKGM